MKPEDSWEYLVVRDSAESADGWWSVVSPIERYRQDLEDQGWELAAVENGTYVFRRPLPETEEDQEDQETLH